MACEFCEETNYVLGYQDGEYILDVRFDYDNAELDIMVRHNGNTVIDKSIAFNFCPICSRILK